MITRSFLRRLALAAVLLLGLPARAPAQTAAPVTRPFAAHLVVPSARLPVFSPVAGTVALTEVSAGIDIVQQVATTTLDLTLTNTSSARLEAEVVLPVPAGAVLRGFTFQGAASEPTAELLARTEARRLYDGIVARTRDPALLEFADCQLIRSSVFPVEARAGQKVRITYEQVLVADGDRVDYVLPRTESIDYRVPWQVAVRIEAATPIGTVYSPSHCLDTVRKGPRRVTARLASGAATEPGAFRLSYLLQGDGATASLLAYPEAGTDGGYFLLLASPPSAATSYALAPDTKTRTQKREVILVIDRSGSMAGPKLEQVRAAALQVVESLDEGEAFNLVVYSDTVELFAPRAVVKSPETMDRVRAYLRDLRVNGGTNLHDALAEALRQPPTPGFLPLVLFLTDGLPTVGQTAERPIRRLATEANPHRRRVFTFGVGVDVNTPLLDRIALDTRATATYVLPQESVETRVAQVFRRLTGPALAEPRLRAVDATGAVEPGRVHDLQPDPLPDFFEGDQLVLLGRYSGRGPLVLELSGRQADRERTYRFRFELDRATTANAYIPRLWASRRIARLTDAIRDLGADAPFATARPFAYANSAPPSVPYAARAVGPEADPRATELIAEIVRLSKEFGILTEYTAFLAREGTDLSQPSQVLAAAYRNFSERAMQTRSGNGAVNQSLNNAYQMSQNSLNLRNGYVDANLERVQVGSVQQVNDRAFFQRNGRWIDSQLIDHADTAPRRVVTVGSPEFRELAGRLAAQNRAGTISLAGEVLLQVDGETILVK